jgi:hypothetical protein
MNFISHSQAGQDAWIFDLIVKPEHLLSGTFLDVGCGDPVFISNTYALEQLGWTGLLVDADAQWLTPCEQKRSSPFLVADATIVNWTACSPHMLFDYLSLDVDHVQVEALKNLLKHGVRFRAATIETDRYRFGDEPRRIIRELLAAANYELICGDVSNLDQPFEDWYVTKDDVALLARAEVYRCHGRNWHDILAGK